MKRILQQYKICISGIVLSLLSSVSVLHAQKLYVSKQTGEYSSYTGSQSKTTDKNENGTVTITTQGPILYSVTPNDFTIGPNETKTWVGKVYPDVSNSPAPGLSAPAKLNGHFQVHFKSGGIWDAEENRWVQEGKVSDQSGDVPFDFNVYSIKVSIPDTICIGQSKTGEVDALPYPENDGGSFSWSVLSGTAVSLSNTNSKTVTIKLNDTTSLTPIKVVFVIQGVSYSAVAMVKYCRVSCHCDPAITNMNFGPLQVKFNTAATAAEPDGQGYCLYTSGNASFDLVMDGGIAQKQVPINGASVSFKKNCQNGKFKDVVILWNGDADIGEIGFLDAHINNVNLKVSPSGALGGAIAMNVIMNQDKALSGGLVLLKQGISGPIGFAYNNVNGWNGNFNFSGVKNIHLDLVKGSPQTILASIYNASLNASGSYKGNFTGIGGAFYNVNGFNVTLNTLNLGMELSILNGLVFSDGSGTATIDQIGHTQGSIALDLEFGAGNCNANIHSNNLFALGMTFSNQNLMTDFNQNFDISIIRGSLMAKHPLFDQGIYINAFEIRNGALTQFSGAGKVLYNGYNFNLINTQYTAGNLLINAKLELFINTDIVIPINNMSINDAGNISAIAISGNLLTPFVNVDYKAILDANQNFSGTFTGNLGQLPIDGNIEIGAATANAFNYALLNIANKSNIALSSGFNVDNIQGVLGLNYKVDKDKTTISANNANNKSNSIYLKLGMSDYLKSMSMSGELSDDNLITIPSMTMNGYIGFSSKKPNLKGEFTTTINLGNPSVGTKAGATFILDSYGGLLVINNCVINYGNSGKTWGVSLCRIAGELSLVAINTTNFYMSGNSDKPNTYLGEIDGTCIVSFIYQSPNNSGVETIGPMHLNSTGSFKEIFSQDGFKRPIELIVVADGTIKLNTFFFETNLNVNGVGRGYINLKNGKSSFYGNATLHLPFGTTQSFDFNIGL